MVTKNNGDYLKYKTIVSHEAWREIESKYPNHKEIGLDYWTVRKILSSFMDLVLDEVIANPLGFVLPYESGCLRMVGVPISNISDFTKKVKKIEYARTGNTFYQMRWLLTNAKVKHNKFYNMHTPILIRKRIVEEIRKDNFFNWMIVPEYNLVSKIQY